MNFYYIMNIYKKPNIIYIIEYIIGFESLPKILIKNDFNIYYELFKPNIGLALQKAMLAKWVERLGLDYIRKPGVPIYCIKHTINFTFSNIPFVANTIR